MALFLLPGLQFQIHAPVSDARRIRACSMRDQFAEPLAVPGHHFGQQQRVDGGVALGQIQLGADAAAFFAAQQDVALEHQLADVLEADRRLRELSGQNFAAILSIILVVEKVFATSPAILRVPARCQNRIEKIWWGVMNVPSRSIAPMRSPSPSARKAGVVFARKHGLAQRGDVRLDGLRIHAAEKRIAGAANFIAGDAVGASSVRAAGRAPRRAWDRQRSGTSRRASAPNPPASRWYRDRACEHRANGSDPLRGGRGGTPSRSTTASSFSICATIEGRRRTAVAGLELQPFQRAGLWLAVIMNSAGRAALPHQQRNRRRRTGASPRATPACPSSATVSAAARAKRSEPKRVS